ncbi:MAG TPA: PmoA family protein [Pyrinomonadaceae bacterium]|nr:PmoA family protein [Pyrinomonadaceae bacterium]
MTKIFPTICFLALLCANWANAQTVKVAANEAKQRVDVEIDGKLFTSYRFEERIKRPVLLPIMTIGGGFITRGFPIETRNGETIGHPHQVGMSLSYGDVNGVDFWNTSTFRTAKELERMGRIVHRKILKIKSGKRRGELVTQSDWILPNGKVILSETTKYIFQAEGKIRRIDRETILTANDENVVFGDSKEGMFAIHLTRELQQASNVPEKTIDENGKISEAAIIDNFTGEYLNSAGLTGDKIWGTLGKWASASGRIGKEEVTVAVFDFPKNINYPSYMMVRGYGLLALNPFGRKLFEPEKDARKFILEPKKSIEFRHRVLILAEKAKPETIEKEYQNFIR